MGRRINLITCEEASELLTVSEDTVRRLIKAGQLPAYLIGNRTRIDEADIWAYVEAHKTKAAALRRSVKTRRTAGPRPCPYRPGDKVV